MSEQHNIRHNVHPQPLAKRALQGAGLAIILLSGFLGFLKLKAGDIDMGILIFWPYSTVTIGGACGGVFYYLMDYFRYRGSWQKIVVNIICALAYFVALWLSLVFALAQTGHWD